MKTQMTVISGSNMSFLEGEERTPGEIVEFLKTEALFRNFGTVLQRVYPGEDLAPRLSAGLAELTGEETESVARKVRNWVRGKNMPKNRETLFQICFVLGLDEERACRVLASASDTGIHYRNPKELAYAYALRAGKTYGEALLLEQQAREFYPEKGKKKRGKKAEEIQVYTRQLRSEFSLVESEEELFEFLREHREVLGELHETAYEKFMELLGRLQNPESGNWEDEEKYTMDQVVREYIRMNVPETRKLSDYSDLQRLVKKYWPNESSLLNMKNRREDVSRKVLLLLYLVTEEFDEPEEEDWYLEEDEDDPDTVLEMRFERVNLFLESCGMNRLDPGSPFDFLVLYAMKTDGGDFVSDRMREVLDELFAADN